MYPKAIVLNELLIGGTYRNAELNPHVYLGVQVHPLTSEKIIYIYVYLS